MCWNKWLSVTKLSDTTLSTLSTVKSTIYDKHAVDP